MSAPETISKGQEPTYKELSNEDIVSRLQDVFNELQLLKQNAPDWCKDATAKHIGYLQRGVLEAKRIIKEGQQ